MTRSRFIGCKEWIPQVTISGHFGPVEEIAWDPTETYLVSISSDQTARVFAKWTNGKNENVRAPCNEIFRSWTHKLLA